MPQTAVAPDPRLMGTLPPWGTAMGGGGAGLMGHEGDCPIPPQVAGKSHPPVHAEDGAQVSGSAALSTVSIAPGGSGGLHTEQEGHRRGAPGL